jgi:hypothetical protein
MIVRPGGQAGPLVVYDLVARKRQVALPSGLVSADGRRFFSTRLERRSTIVTRSLLPSGRTAARTVLAGRYVLQGVSASAGRIVLARVGGPRGSTTLLVLDGRRWSVRHRQTLRGAYQVETFSPDGGRLFLVHWRANGYDLQTLDLATRRLRPTPLSADEDGEKMAGTAWAAVASRDGRWLLTLYLKPGAGSGFVHALDLRTGVGHCVDLPVRRVDVMALGASALVLSPDEQRLFVATPLLGRIFVVDLRTTSIASTARFTPLPATQFAFGLGPAGAVSRNGRMLVFGAGRLVWVYDVPYVRVRGPYAAAPKPTPATVVRRSVTGLGFLPDGRRLVVLRGDRRLVTLDAASGRPAP